MITSVLLYLCTLYKCISVPVYYCTRVTQVVYQCTSVPAYQCTSETVYQCTLVLVYQCTGQHPVVVCICSYWGKRRGLCPLRRKASNKLHPLWCICNIFAFFCISNFFASPVRYLFNTVTGCGEGGEIFWDIFFFPRGDVDICFWEIIFLIIWRWNLSKSRDNILADWLGLHYDSSTIPH